MTNLMIVNTNVVPFARENGQVMWMAIMGRRDNNSGTKRAVFSVFLSRRG